LAGSTFAPAAGAYGYLLYEDLWPCTGDLDYNDLVLAYNWVIVDDGGSPAQVTDAQLTLNVQAMGASRCGGIGVRIPAAYSAVSSVERRIGTPDTSWGEPWTPQSLGLGTDVTQDASGNTVVWLVDDARATLCGDATGFLDTDPDQAATACAPAELNIHFAGDPGLDPGQAPYDVFWTGCGDRSQQIHLPTWGPTPEAASSPLLGTCSDDPSNPYQVQPSGTLAGLPWVLNIGENPGSWPMEHRRIDQTWPSIVDFASTGSPSNFYAQPDADPTREWTTGAGQPPAAPVISCDGNLVSCPAASCLDALTWGRSTGDGQYYIDPANTGSATAVTCDMANGGWTLAYGDVGDPIVQDVPAAVRAIPITEVRGTAANGTTSTLPYDLAGQDLDAMYNSPWIYTGFEQDNYIPLGDGLDKLSSIYLMDDHDPLGGCTYDTTVRQTQQPETPRGIISFGVSNTNSFVDHGTCSYSAYEGSPIRTLWVR